MEEVVFFVAAFGAIVLAPLAVLHVRSAIWRGVHAALAVLLGAVAAGLSRETLPLSGRDPPPLGLAGSEDAGAVATALAHALAARPELLLAALTLGLFSAALPLARGRGLWPLAVAGAVSIAVLLLPVASIQAVPAVAGIWLCCAVFGARELRPER